MIESNMGSAAPTRNPPSTAVRPPSGRPVSGAEPAAVAALNWLPAQMLNTAPPPRKWLLESQERTGPCGVLPRGEVAALIGAGGTSKTMALIDLAVSVALGLPWLGVYATEPGYVALNLGEEDSKEIWRRFYAVAEAHNLSTSDREAARVRLMVAPLAGLPATLISGAGEPSEIATGLRQKLEAQPCEWSLVAFDPLSRFAGLDTETNNNAATAFVRVLESFKTLPGAPTVAVSHHTSKAARQPDSSGRMRSSGSAYRGVTGLHDGVRWAGELTESEQGTIEFKITKSNYGPKAPTIEPLQLVRGPNGTLRKASIDDLAEGAERQGSKRAQKQSVKEEEIEEAVVAEVTKHGSRHTSKTKLQAALSIGSKQDRLHVIGEMVEAGRLVIDDSGARLLEPEPAGSGSGVN